MSEGTRRTDEPTAAILAWLAAIGAAGAEELARGCSLRPAAARSRLAALERDGLTRSHRLLRGEPALHTLTAHGLRAAGRPELDAVTVSAAGFAHQLAVARVACALAAEHGLPAGERELRALERAAGRPLASARVGYARDGSPALHRPDLVCWTERGPVAIEVELTVKAPGRLGAIVRGWARSRAIAGVVYYARPPAARAVGVAVRAEQAQARVAIRPLGEAGLLPDFGLLDESHPKRAVASPSQSTTPPKGVR